MSIKTARLESAYMIYDEKGKLISIIKRDDLTGEHVVYTTKKAGSTDIAELIAGSITMSFIKDVHPGTKRLQNTGQ